MTNDEQSLAERNIAVVRGFYDALGSSDDGELGEQAMALVIDTFRNEKEIELNLGEPYGGTYRGPAEIAVGRHRLHELCGYTTADHSAFRYYADGPTRVVVEATNNGTDLAGHPWSMTVVELVDVVDGRIARKRTFFQDPGRLLEIMAEREADLKNRLADAYWRDNNPLLAITRTS
jgi:ketosteroid isomerase-like protein